MPDVSSSWSVQRFLGRLGSSDPTPGGGSAAALAGALGCALGTMVGRILLSRPKMTSAQRRTLRRDLGRLDALGRRLERLIAEDARAYRALVKAQRTGQGLLNARKKAMDCPAEIGRKAAKASQLLRNLSRQTGPYLGSDLKAGTALLRGASEAAQAMVEINRK